MPNGPCFFRRAVVLGGLAAASVPRSARAGAWPEQPLRLVHGYVAGGNADVVAHILAERLAARLGQPVTVERKPGAGGRIATTHIAEAPADGYTLAVLPGGHAIAAAMHVSQPYDTLNDFTFISMLTNYPFILVTYPDHRVKTVAELIAAAKASSDRLSYGTAGHGSGQHLSGALLASMGDIRLQHRPFGGGAVGSTELLAKHIDFLFDTPTLLLELIRSGFVRAVAVTGRERFFALPDVPTIAETVAGYETSSWLGLAGPRELPDDIVTRLNQEIAAVLAEPVMNERLRSLGNLPAPSTPADFRQRVAADVAKWGKVVADAGITRSQ